MTVNDLLYGTVHNDRILGGVGHDVIYGGPANDRLAGENGNDRLHGGSGDDYLTAGAGNDRLYSGDGSDLVRSGSGKDAVVFNTQANGVRDTLLDFSVVDDTIWLDNNVFTALGSAWQSLTPSAFWIGTAAHDADDRVIYDSVHGVLSYDPDGIGGTRKVAIANLEKGLAMTNADIFIV
ncbi:calcium-binding protein [Microvirga sp. KLBC 81]|nr:calcium-binding protein [Microvirga sp. KLBC 81]